MYKFKVIIALIAVSSIFTSCKSDHLDAVEVIDNYATFRIGDTDYTAQRGISFSQYQNVADNNFLDVKIYNIIESRTNLYFKLGTLLNENIIGEVLEFDSADGIVFSEIVLPKVGEDYGKKYVSISGSVVFVSENEVKLSGCKFYEFNSYEVGVQDSIFVDVAAVINYIPEDKIFYCETKENVATSTWIESFKVKAHPKYYASNVSGTDDGYHDYSSIVYRFSKNFSFNMELTPGGKGTPSFVHWKVFVDINNDGSFDGTEEIFATSTASKSTISTPIAIPDMKEDGKYYKMRVMMQVVGDANESNSITGCSNVGVGEVEDYTAFYVFDKNAAE